MEVWYILVDYDYNLLEEPHRVALGHKGDILSLKEKIKEGPYKETLTHVNTAGMEVWRFKSLILDDGVDPDRVGDLVRPKSPSGDSEGQKLGNWIPVMRLQLQVTEPLVIRVKPRDKGVQLRTLAGGGANFYVFIR